MIPLLHLLMIIMIKYHPWDYVILHVFILTQQKIIE